jgi:prolyl-tRNA synthetase
LINLDVNDEKLRNYSDKLYENLKSKNIDVIYDDTNQRPGVKFASNDLIGVPIQIIIGKKNMELNLVEVKYRKSGIIKLVALEEIEQFLVDLI